MNDYDLVTIFVHPNLRRQIQAACYHAAHIRKSHASRAADTIAHFILPARTLAAEDFVEDGVDAAAVVDAAAEPLLPLLLLLPLAMAAPTGRIKPPSTPGGVVLEPVPAAAALYAASVLPPELLWRKCNRLASVLTRVDWQRKKACELGIRHTED
jgi:hypothetical protein